MQRVLLATGELPFSEAVRLADAYEQGVSDPKQIRDLQSKLPHHVDLVAVQTLEGRGAPVGLRFRGVKGTKEQVTSVVLSRWYGAYAS